MSSPHVQPQQYALRFEDGSSSPQPGINVLVFPAGADTSQVSNAIDGGTTDSSGTYLTAPLSPGVMYAFTTSGAVASGTFFAAINNSTPIVIDPTHTSGTYPGTSGGGLTTVPSVIRIGTLIYNYSIDPAGPIGTGASVRSVSQAWTSGTVPAGMHYCDGTLVTVGSPSPDNISFAAVPDPNAAISSPALVGYSLEARFSLSAVTLNAAGTYPGFANLLISMITGGRIATRQNFGGILTTCHISAPAAADVSSSKIYAQAVHKEIILPSSGGVFPTMAFHVQADSDPNALLTGALARVWIDMTLTPLYS